MRHFFWGGGGGGAGVKGCCHLNFPLSWIILKNYKYWYRKITFMIVWSSDLIFTILKIIIPEYYQKRFWYIQYTWYTSTTLWDIYVFNELIKSQIEIALIAIKYISNLLNWIVIHIWEIHILPETFCGKIIICSWDVNMFSSCYITVMSYWDLKQKADVSSTDLSLI